MKDKLLAIKEILGGADLHDALYLMYQWSLRNYIHKFYILHNSIKKGSIAARQYKCSALRSKYATRKVKTVLIADGAKIMFSCEKIIKPLTASESIKIMRDFFKPNIIASDLEIPSIWVFAHGPNGKMIQHSYPLSFYNVVGDSIELIEEKYNSLRDKLGNTPVVITDRDLHVIWHNNADNIWLQVGDKYGSVNERLINLQTGRSYTCEEEDELRTMIYKMKTSLKKKAI